MTAVAGPHAPIVAGHADCALSCQCPSMRGWNDGAPTYLGIPKYPEIADKQIAALMHAVRWSVIEILPAFEQLLSTKEVENNSISAEN